MQEMYRKVWDADGVLFEVPTERGSDLVLNHGWSNTPPVVDAPKPKKTSKKVEEEAVPSADTLEANEPVEEPVAQSE